MRAWSVPKQFFPDYVLLVFFGFLILGRVVFLSCIMHPEVFIFLLLGGVASVAARARL